ncbi:hypothetical protein L1887_53090 [Cichorium endivia]|nr:hypothetical protein L1887_53090 [Cichorium endivia]
MRGSATGRREGQAEEGREGRVRAGPLCVSRRSRFQNWIDKAHCIEGVHRSRRERPSMSNVSGGEQRLSWTGPSSVTLCLPAGLKTAYRPDQVIADTLSALVAGEGSWAGLLVWGKELRAVVGQHGRLRHALD